MIGSVITYKEETMDVMIETNSETSITIFVILNCFGYVHD